MRIRSLTVWHGVCLLFVVVTGCDRHMSRHSRLVPFTEVSHEEKVGPEITTLVVNNRVGDVSVVAGVADQIHIEAKVKIKEIRALETAKGTFEDHVCITATGNTLTIADAHSDQPDRNDWSVSMIIQVPPRLDVRVNNGVGDITVEDMEAELIINDGTGDITVHSKTTGAVSASAGTGDVAITIAKVSGKIELAAGVGDVDVMLDAVEGTVHAESGTGDVRVTVAESSPRKDVSLKSGVGDVRLRIPSGSAGTFSLATGVGSIRVKGHPGIHVTKVGTTAKAQGVVGEGKPAHHLQTGTGDIVLE